jgi:undecaprenyl-diphosphatase
MLRRLRKLERRELIWLAVGLGACVALFVFLKLASEITEGDTTALDTRMLVALRSARDPSKPVGPAWIEPMLLDLTALGSPTVLGLVVIAVVGFLLLQGLYRSAAVAFGTTVTGMLASNLLKEVFGRPRPSIVPHLREVVSSSFPSGHAMQSAIVYLTLAAMLMRIVDRRLTKLYVLGMAVLMTLLVGASRVYLGVHYPTDVIGGWIIGFAWASLCWLMAQWFEVRLGIRREKRESERAQAREDRQRA